MTAAELEAALARPTPAIVAYLTAWFPDEARFFAALDALERSADAIEIGVPFSDPMADGPVIQRASHVALAAGATLDRLLTRLEQRAPERPRILMSYLNPLLALPEDVLAPRLARAGISALVVPDLPYEESGALAAALAREEIALAPMVTPLTHPDRLASMAAAARGFVYAVTRTGTTGAGIADPQAVARYLARVREASRAPVLAGFGVRARSDLAALCPPADGVVVGTAIVEAIERGEDLTAWITRLR